jgi:hypothetical protein
MAAEIIPPKILSLEFHTRFFPRLIWNRLRQKKKEEQGTSFVSTMELTLVLVGSVILAVIGIPLALTRRSIVGLIMSVIGAGGVLAIFVLSVGAQRGHRPTYDRFLSGIFFFFVFLGIFIGIPIGMDNHSTYLGVLASLGGLFGGYMLGIFAGLWLQHLGWMAIILDMLAGFAAIAMGSATLIMLLLLAVR